MLTGRKIILGITGSIAAYKAALLVRLFVKNGAEVKVVMTKSATEFVSELTFSNLSQNPVFSGLWDGTWTEHVHLGAWADLMVVAPASANTLGKMATGVTDNALLAVYLSAKCPVMVAPAMDLDMYRHESTKRSLDQLRKDGVIVLEAGTGFLASGLEGEGRMAEPEEILEAVENHFKKGPLAGKKVLVTAGPTRERIDPVRFISNNSTGTMGYQIALEAHAQGADVVLVSGPVSTDVRLPFEPVQVETAGEMFTAVSGLAPEMDLIIMAAAVADYTPQHYSEEKVKKSDSDLSIPLKRTTDILEFLGKHKKSGQVLVGFAMETQNEEENAIKKLEKKNLDYIILNSLKDEGAGFGNKTNKISIINRNKEIQRFNLKSKKEVARDILEVVGKQLEK